MVDNPVQNFTEKNEIFLIKSEINVNIYIKVIIIKWAIFQANNNSIA